MYVMVMYDISVTKTRTRVARFLLDFGLRRYQHSVFLGRATPKQRDDLVETLRRVLGESAGTIAVMPVHRPNLDQLVELFNPPSDPTDEDET